MMVRQKMSRARQQRGRVNSNRKRAIAVLCPSPARRAVGIGMLIALGGLLVYMGLSTLEAPAAGLVIIALGMSALWAGHRVWIATKSSLELMDSGLYSSDGSTIAEIDNVARVDLGIFALRPSGGFQIVLKSPMHRSWKPGLWWRFGTRVGIGGVTPKAEAKAMAEALAALVQEQRVGELD